MDRPAHILDRRVAQDLDVSGLRVDLDIANMRREARRLALALICTSALIGPPVRAERAAMATRSSGSKPPALAPAGITLPSFHSTASALISHMIAARFFSSSITFSVACVTAIPPAKVTWLTPVEALKPIAVVSPTTGRTCSNGMFSTSATIIAIEAREPPISG